VRRCCGSTAATQLGHCLGAWNLDGGGSIFNSKIKAESGKTLTTCDAEVTGLE
jgi:hypothetical protein